MIDANPMRRHDDHESPLRKIVELWRTRDIQLCELFCAMVFLWWSVWLVLPWYSFANPSFAVFRFLAREEVWGLTGIVSSLFWIHGVIRECKVCRQVGAVAMFLVFATVFFSLAKVAVSSTGIPVYGSLALLPGFLFVRQRWEIGAGES